MKNLHTYYSFRAKGVVSTPHASLANVETLASRNLQRMIDFKIKKTLKKLQKLEVHNGLLTDPSWRVNPNA